MADQPVTLDHARIRLGQEVVTLADRLGLGVSGAAWFLDQESQTWVLELATPLVDSPGPAWIYGRLAAILQKVPLPAGVSLVELRLASPGEALWRVISAAYHVGQSALQMSGNLVNGMLLPDMVLYRALRASPGQPEAFERRYRELVSA